MATRNESRVVLASASLSSHAVSFGAFLTTVGGLCLVIGYLTNWLSPFARRHRKRVARLDSMLDDWNGYPSRPGFDEIPSVPIRLKSMEDKFEQRETTQLVMEHNISTINKSLDAAHRRLDAFGKTFEQEHGEHIAMLRQVQHDVTQIRMAINYINNDRERKEREWVIKLQEQGLETPHPTGLELPSELPSTGG